jgi:hypothetical protein
MTRHSGISIDDDGVTLVIAPEDPATGKPEIAFAPALLVLTPSGPPITGRRARRLAASGVGAAFSDFCARVGDPVPVVGSDGSARWAADLVALTIRCLIRDLGSPQDPGQHLTIAFPATWEPYRVGELGRALARVELDGPTTSFVPRPVAAIRMVSGRRRGPVVVADIGRYGTEVTTLTGGPVPKIAGVHPADLGAATLDRVVLEHVLDELSGDLVEQVDRPDLVARCRAARHGLTRNAAAVIEVPVTDGIERVRITRAEFEESVHEPVLEMAATISRALEDEGGDSAGDRLVVITGDGADLPLLAQALSAGPVVRPWMAPDAAAIATGAAGLSADRARSARAARAAHREVPARVRLEASAPPDPDARIGAAVPAPPAPSARDRVAPAPAPQVRRDTPVPTASAHAGFETSAPGARSSERPRSGFRTTLAAASAAIALLVGGAAISTGGHDSGPGWHTGH